MLGFVKILRSRFSGTARARLKCDVYSSMTLLSKIWYMCFAGFGKVIWKSAAAGPILPVLLVYGMLVCSCALDGGACLFVGLEF
jgi:hypothetical protein